MGDGARWFVLAGWYSTMALLHGSSPPSAARGRVCARAKGIWPGSCATTVTRQERRSQSHRLSQVALDSMVEQLCAGVSSSAVEKCYTHMPGQVPPQLKIQICQGALSSDAAVCFRAIRARSREFSDEHTVALCTHGPPADRGKGAACVNALPPTLNLSPDQMVGVCRGSGGTGPADCLGVLPRGTLPKVSCPRSGK